LENASNQIIKAIKIIGLRSFIKENTRNFLNKTCLSRNITEQAKDRQVVPLKYKSLNNKDIVD